MRDKIYIGAARSGKTRKSIMESHLFGTVIVCCNQHQADFLYKYAKSERVSIPKPISFKEFLERKDDKEKRFLIDDVQSCLKLYTGKKITGLTVDVHNKHLIELDK